MFGIGFTELLLISIVAILFLGPDKLPEALVQMAKFIKSVKKTVGDAKSSLEEEMKISDLKEEALSYKSKLDSATNELRGFKNFDFDDLDSTPTTTPATKKEDPYAKAPSKLTSLEDDDHFESEVETKNETVTFKKQTEKNEEKKGNA
jgi:sec-independent protein translocase protein TatB